MVGLGLGVATLGASLAHVLVPRGWRRHGARNGPTESTRSPRPRHAHRPRGRIAIAIEKAIDVRAPLREVFGICARVENLPGLIPHLSEARRVAADRHHWVLAEPSGGPIEWDTVITRFGANQVIAWETPPGSVVRHSGRLAFRSNADGSTRVNVGLSYVLPPGPFGERVAPLLNAEELDEALRRWRTRVERHE